MDKPRVAVVGSGFGGGVTACRLAESGRFQVEVLERGRRYERNQFPRRPEDLQNIFWDPEEGCFGLFELRSFDRTKIDVVTASGLGGGSLVYSNVLYRMPPDFFRGWPGGITRKTLDPYYQRALDMFEARPYPLDRPGWPYAPTPKARALIDAAARLSADGRPQPAVTFERPHLAVQFGQHPGLDLRNAQGRRQSACNSCGECNVGCNTHSKNTVDLNYLERARTRGAVIRTHTEVIGVEPGERGGWDVICGDPRYRDWERIHYDRVVLAAGSLGSTRLLLQLQEQTGTLSPALGSGWTPNGDLIGLVMNTRHPVYPTTGPVITGALRFDTASYPDGHPGGLWIEDGGLPSFVALAVAGRVRGLRAGLSSLRRIGYYLRGVFGSRAESNLGADLGPVLVDNSRMVSRTLPLLAMGCDRATGTLRLDPRRRGHRDRLHLSWRPGRGQRHYRRTRRAMRRIAGAMGGRFVENPLSGALRRYISVHALGGCPLGDDHGSGAVSAETGEVFGAPGLYVLDGSILPSSVGPNPSLTIAALAEMYAEHMVDREVNA